MNSEGFEQWFKLNKNLTGPMSEIGRATTDIVHRTLGQNLELFEENIARLSDQLKRLSTVRKPEEFISLQKDYINENMSAAVENFQKLTHLAMENVEELTRACGSLREPVVQAARKATEKTEKYAEKAEKYAK